MAKSYYKTINGKNYDRDMLAVAEKATPRKRGKALIEIDLAKKLFKALADGNEYTDIEKKSMKYIRDNYDFTKEADSYIRTEVRKFAANQAIKAKEEDKKKKELEKKNKVSAKKKTPVKKKQTNKTNAKSIPVSEKSKLNEEEEPEIVENDTSEEMDEIDFSNTSSYSDDRDRVDYQDDNSGFREFVAYKDHDQIQAKERRKKFMIRAGLIAIFLLIILGITWSVCKPKSGELDDPSGFETLDSVETKTEPVDDTVEKQEPTKDLEHEEESKIEKDTEIETGSKTTIKEEGPGDEEFKNEPGVAAPVKRIAFDINNQKSSIRFVNSLEVPFVRNQGDITAEGKKALNDLAQVLKKYPNMLVRIEGHTCWIGSQEDNQKLSEERAKIVNDYLISQGVDSGSVEYRGYGELASIATNRTKEGRLRNRRVEFSVLKLR